MLAPGAAVGFGAVPGKVVDLTFLGNLVDCHATLGDGTRIRVQVDPGQRLEIGLPVSVAIDAAAATVFMGGAPKWPPNPPPTLRAPAKPWRFASVVVTYGGPAEPGRFASVVVTYGGPAKPWRSSGVRSGQAIVTGAGSGLPFESIV